MKKINLNKIVNTRKLVHRIFIMLWVVLAFCLAFKFLFNWWFPIVVKNQAFISICNFIDNNQLVYYLISLSSMLFTDYIWFLIAIKKKKAKSILFFILVAIGIIGIHYVKFWINETIGNIIEIGLLVLVPIIYHLKFKNFKRIIMDILYPIIIYLIINFWQLNILLIRDIQDTLKNTQSIISLILQIDYYIFIVIMYMEVNLMGIFGGWFFGKSETELLALKEEELKKENPDQEKIKQIDARLEELKKEEK